MAEMSIVSADHYAKALAVRIASVVPSFSPFVANFIVFLLLSRCRREESGHASALSLSFGVVCCLVLRLRLPRATGNARRVCIPAAAGRNMSAHDFLGARAVPLRQSFGHAEMVLRQFKNLRQA
jgi:hypothetical protein